MYKLKPNGLLSQSANNITANGVWLIYGGSSSYDLPNSYGILITIMSIAVLTYGYTGVQLFINPSGGFWFRTRGASEWGATWYELQVKTTE